MTIKHSLIRERNNLKVINLLRNDDGNKYKKVCGTLKKLKMFKKRKLLVRSTNVTYDEHLS